MAKRKNELVVTENDEEGKLKEELKEELTNYIDGKIKKGFKEEIENINKRIIKDKNRTILVKNIIILLLILIIGFLIFILYRNNYFDKFFNKNNEVVEKETKEEKEVKEDTKEKEEKEKEEQAKEELKQKEELKKIYAPLIDNYIISENSNYLNDYYNGELTSELRNYLALNRMDLSSISQEEDYNIIDEDDLKKEYNQLFSDNYEGKSFDYNGNKIKYIDKIKTYITTSLFKKDDSHIKKEIIDINKEEDIVTIKVVEGIIDNNKLFNIKKEEIEDYQNDSLIKYQDKLNVINYVFKKGLLIKIEKSYN